MFAIHRFPNGSGMWLQGSLGSGIPKYQWEHCKVLSHQSAPNIAMGFPREMPYVPDCLHSVWILLETEGNRRICCLSKPIKAKITDLLYIDDIKIYAASEGKLGRIMKETRRTMSDVGLQWYQNKCAVVHVKRGQLEVSSIVFWEL